MAKFTGGKMLAKVNRESPDLGSLLSSLIDSHNHLASQAGIDPVGQTSAPLSPQSLSVTVIGEQMHIRVTDNNPTSRARTYFTEIHTDANFSSPKMIVQHGSTRDAQVVVPTLNSTGASQPYYLRTYSQDPGSPPSDMVPYPVAVTMTGTTKGDLPASAGSGTGGSASGEGYGVFPTRNATGPKRKV